MKRKFTDDEIVSILGSELARAEGGESSGDGLEQNRTQATNYYLGRARGDEQAGHSQVQSLDVSDMVEATLAQVMPSFAGDIPASFEPLSEQDEQQAELETRAVANVLMEDNRGYAVFYQAVKDALLYKNGFVKVWCEEQTEARIRTFRNLTGNQKAQVLRMAGDGAEVMEDSEDGLYQVKAKRTRKMLRIAPVPPDCLCYAANHDSVFWDQIRFVAEIKRMTRSDLVAAGYSRAVVDELPSDDADSGTGRASRQVSQTVEPTSALHKDQEVIKVYECYLRLDIDGDGVSELLRCILAGTQLLEMEPAPFIPYATGTAFMVAHRVSGLSLFDKLKGVQDAKTAALRQWLDNLEFANNSKLGVGPGVNVDDLLDPESRLIRFTGGTAAEQLLPIVVPDLGQSSANLLSYLDKVRSERGGASLDLQSAEMQLYGETAHGVERQMASREQLAGLVARTLAETLVRSTFLLAHECLRVQYQEPIKVRMAGKWIEVDPSQWTERDRVNVTMGLSPAERQRKAANLTQVIQMQQQLLAADENDILVSTTGFYRALMDWGRASEIDGMESYFLDPASDESQAAAQQQAQAQQQSAQQMLAMQQQLQQIQTQLEAWKHSTELQFKYFSEVLGAEVEEAKLVGTATVELQKLEQQGTERATAGTNGARPG